MSGFPDIAWKPKSATADLRPCGRAPMVKMYYPCGALIGCSHGVEAVPLRRSHGGGCHEALLGLRAAIRPHFVARIS